MPHARLAILGFAPTTFLSIGATAAYAAPLQFLTGAGDKATPVVWLTWGVLLVSVVVIVIIAGLLAAAVWRRPTLPWTLGQKAVLLPDEGGLNWLWLGVGLSALVLLISVVWTVKVLADIQAPGSRPSITIEVTGRQWWWQVHYISPDGRGFNTANEIHIPAGEIVRLKLVGGDVIHSFWVPQLAGKMDAIPGLTNETWIEASHPGIYQGQCTEYCGVEHSKMLFRVIAQTPADFHAWQAHQLAEPAQRAITATKGEQAFVDHCGNCHSVRGTAAQGSLGPDLSHLMTRQTIASGVLPNDAHTLAAWIADPQGVKPGNSMPVVNLSADERSDITAYLLALN
ncbi:MAG TPA: cytochrome c oxidase subunit II [Rhizomicrobium sp.]|jgi:cytochrome c oxidase subunit 2